jgi:glycine/D-amino acid oxidase-like deaminating enzyme
MHPDRRRFLKMAGLGLGIGSSFGFGPRLKTNELLQQNEEITHQNLKPVLVSPERVIRTVVGLRPFRPTGFVLRSEQLGNKTIIHNYGHGGGGFSLSWGTAKLAVDMALQTRQQTFAVLGCGVIGLSTARLLQRKGFAVTIYAKDLPPETTSNIAGAQWSPVSVFEKGKGSDAFMSQYYQASKIAQRMFQDMVGDKYGVYWRKNYFLGTDFDFPGGRDLYAGYHLHHDAKTYFGFEQVSEVSTLMIEPPVYLNAMLDDFYQAGGKLQVKPFESADAIAQLQEPVVMNCTGLGAGKLFGDKELIPVKGQLTVLLPQPEVDYAYIVASYNDLLYMFPRKDGIMLGGTFDHGNWNIDPSVDESERILKGHRRIADTLSK